MGLSELMTAILEENVEVVSQMCAREASEDQRFSLDRIDEEERITPLCVACKLNNLGLVDVLLQHCASPNVPTTVVNRNKAPIHFVSEIEDADTEIVKSLLDNGAYVDMETMDFETALHFACKNDNHVLAELLVDSGANVNIVDLQGKSALSIACERKNVKMIQFLVENGADINNSDGMQSVHPLRMLIQLNCTDGVQFLLQKDVCMNDHSFLSDAVLRSNLEIMNLLLEHIIDINKSDSVFRFSPLHHACMTPIVHPSVVQKLLENGAYPNKKSISNDTPLHYACQRLNVEKVKFLLYFGSDISLQNDLGLTPLLVVFKSVGCVEEKIKIVELLLRAGARLNSATIQTLKNYKENLDPSEFRQLEAFLLSKMSQALTLKQLCRLSIRQICNFRFHSEIEHFKNLLPKTLIDYISLLDILYE